VVAPAAVYRPRHPQRTSFYQLFERHFDRYVAEYDERFEHREGPLRRVVPRVVGEYLECGRLHGGFARIRCPSCRGEHLLAFSCQTRNFCPSCQTKRGALFAELLVESVLEDVPHRHVVFTIPKALRGLFARERRLLGLLSRTAHDSVQQTMQAYFDHRDLSVGTVASLQTFGSYAANFHPHVHALITDGAFGADGSFERLPYWDACALGELYRRLVLAALRRKNRLSDEFHRSLLTWVHSGFSVHVGGAILPGDHDSLEHLGRYITRAPLKIDAVRETAQTVIVPTPPHPRTGQREMELDPLEMIHRLCQQIPAPRQHLVRYYGHYSNRSRGARRGQARPRPTACTEDLPPEQRARRRSWARLLRRIFEVDPLLCPRCQVQMRIVSVLTEPTVVDRIVRHVSRTGQRSPFGERSPPQV
jgi:hypothetical protein